MADKATEAEAAEYLAWLLAEARNLPDPAQPPPDP
jgi:hypothetical protein